MLMSCPSHVVVLVCILVTPTFFVSGEVTTNPHHLAKLFIIEEDIANVLRSFYTLDNSDYFVLNYLQLFSSREDELYPRDFMLMSSEERAAYTEEVVAHLVSNPVHVYNLIWRWVKLLPRIVHNNFGLYRDFLEQKRLEFGELGEEAMDSVTQALVRIQFAYRLDPGDLARGDIMGIATKARLNEEQMVEIARRCFSGEQKIRPPINREYATTIEWLEAALEVSDGTGGVNTADITEHLTRTIKLHDEYWISPEGRRGIFPNEELFHERISLHNKTGRQLRQEEDTFLRENWEETGDGLYYDIHSLYPLCRGEVEKISDINIPCRLDNRNEPYLYLAPVRVEVLSIDPELYMFHDILSEKETKVMVKTPGSNLEASRTTDSSGVQGHQKLSNERTQSSAWLRDNEFYELYKITRRLSSITGLRIHPPKDSLFFSQRWTNIEAEAWQVGVYSPGGHYLPHEDAFDGDSMDFVGQDGMFIGNRLASLLIYLNEAKAGGRTVFPKLSISVQPKKGSALLWYNLDDAGKGLYSTLNAACPIVFGTQWVATKWIRHGAQIFKRPCKKDYRPDSSQNTEAV